MKIKEAIEVLKQMDPEATVELIFKRPSMSHSGDFRDDYGEDQAERFGYDVPHQRK